jgi:DNA polymerase III sliding clamp (beta) subunit (PCNA family)
MLTTVRPILVKRLYAVLKDVIVEGTLHFQPSGVRMQELDITQQLCVQLHLHSNEFEEYKQKGEQIRINIVHFFQQFHSITKDDTLSLWIENGMLLQKLSTPVRSRTHMLPIIPCNKTDLLVDSSGWAIHFSIPCTTFHNILKELCNDAATINISLESNLITFSNETTIITHLIENQTVTKPMREFLNLKETKQVFYEGSFLSANLTKIHRATHLGPNVEIHLQSACPMILVYQLQNLGQLRIGVQSI